MATTPTRMSEKEYRALVSSDDDHHWELWDGVLVEKPLLSMQHQNVTSYLGFMLADQLDRGSYVVNINGAKTQYTDRTYFMPGVVVMPAALVIPFLGDPYAFNAFTEPLPFVAEVWSRTVEGYDFGAKLPVYAQRGDLETWFVDPFERTLTAWRRQPDGTYLETHDTSGVVPVLSLPGVSIDLDALLTGWGEAQ